MKNDILHFEKKYYILSNFLRRKLFKQNYDDFHANHFEYEKIRDLLSKKYENIDDLTYRETLRNTSFRAQNVF
jgi:hypothetical protein